MVLDRLQLINRRNSLALLIMLAIVAGSGFARAECDLLSTRAVTSGATAVWLKINDFLVFYLHPAAPHLIGDTLMLPAQPAAHLLGLEYSLSSPDLTTTLSRSGTEVTFTLGARHARVNGALMPLPVPARPLAEPGDGLLIPLRPLLEAFGLPSDWNKESRTLAINSELAMAEPNISKVFLPRVRFQPVPLTPSGFGFAETCQGFHFVVTFEADRLQALPEPLAMYALMQHEEVISIAGPNVHISDDPDNTSRNPCRSIGGGAVCEVKTSFDSDPVRFIIALFVSPPQ